MVGNNVTKITNELMLDLTKDMPMRLIEIEREIVPTETTVSIAKVTIKKPYLERYFAGRMRDGRDIWLHHFLSNDSERHLHNHPFDFMTAMLRGGYTEEYLKNSGEKDFRITLPTSEASRNAETFLELFRYAISDSCIILPNSWKFRNIEVFDWHKIAAVEPDTWTMMVVQPERLPAWFFRNDEGEIEFVKSSPRDWWKDYKTRDGRSIHNEDLIAK